MPFSPQSLEEKPYNLCLNCAHIGKRCDGPNFLAMDTDRWCEWCKLRKDYLGWTNATVADMAGISKVSVDRVMSGNVKDLRISTMQAITKALVNGTWGQYPCAMSEASEPETVYVDNPEMASKCESLKESLTKQAEEHKAALESIRKDTERMKEFYEKEIDFKDGQMLQKDKQLNERAAFMRQKDRYIAILATSLAIALLVIIAALVVDRLNSNIGFFWVENALAAVFGKGNLATDGVSQMFNLRL